VSFKKADTESLQRVADGTVAVTAWFAARVAKIPGSAIDRSIALLAKQTHPVVPFAFGAPAPEAIPTELLAGFAAASYRDQGYTALAYGPTEGEKLLRAALLDDLHANDVAIDESELIVTAGGTQGLDLAMKLFVGPGDLVLAESPTYPNGVAIATSYDGRVLRCPIDANGLVVEAIPDLVARTGETPKLIYAIPTFQNPGGCTMLLERRHKLLDLAARYDAIVIEDDPYGRIWFETPPPTSLWTLERERPGRARRVIAVHTFSKILAPGLRVGWGRRRPAIAR
jgi:2-aminoadipate transaminase